MNININFYFYFFLLYFFLKISKIQVEYKGNKNYFLTMYHTKYERK